MFKVLPKKVWIPIIIVAIVILVGGVLAYQYWWVPKEEVKNIQQQITQTENGQDVTANWQTYTNTKYGFEIKYPSDFVPIIDKYSKELIWLQPKSQPEISEPFIAVGQEKYTLLFQGTWSPVPYSQAGTAKIISSENITINGISFNKDLWSIRPGVDEVISYNTNHNGKYYTIYRGISSPNDATILNQMLSTFKFIDIPFPAKITYSGDWIKAYFPNWARHSVNIMYPSVWTFECCGDTSDFSAHTIYPNINNDKSTWDNGPHITVFDMNLMGCPKDSCSLEELVSLTVIEYMTNHSNYEAVKLNNLASDVFVYQSPFYSNIYVTQVKNGVAKVEFQNGQDGQGFDDNFKTEFLSRITSN